jgi:Na+-transporting methylmalonyl-CoA/oxaloacetate decarboxylase gamma subunit
MRTALSRGDGPLKITNAWAFVAGVGLFCLFGMIVALAFAGWKPESITGMFLGLATLLAAVTAAVRKAEVVEAKTDQQSESLATIERQTDGELKAAIAEAVAEGIDRAAAKYRAEQRQQQIGG